MPSSSTLAPLHQAHARFEGKRVAVLGLAREGIDLTRFLSEAGAHVRVVDQKPAAELANALAALEGLDVQFHLGANARLNLQGVETLFSSPGVPPSHPLLESARRSSVPISSGTTLFFELCPAPIIGITGSAGKTTTTSLLGYIFRSAGRETFVGGNIGKPLLGDLGRITRHSTVVIELSSFQLQPLRRSPHMAVVTNVTPNHLDRHASMEEYWESKGQILAHQQPEDWAILNADDPWSNRYEPRAGHRQFSLTRPVEGAYLVGDQLTLDGEPLLSTHEVTLRGRHNLANILAAALAASLAGVDRSTIKVTASAFRGVPHRLEIVGTRRGVRYVNDSIATAPERSVAALEAFDEPMVLIAGGRDKHLPMDEWARLIARKTHHLVLLGEMGDLVEATVRNVAPGFHAVSRADTMDQAVALAAEAAQPGDVVLLSPGGTSFDLYADFEARGADFMRAVAELGLDA